MKRVVSCIMALSLFVGGNECGANVFNFFGTNEELETIPGSSCPGGVCPLVREVTVVASCAGQEVESCAGNAAASYGCAGSYGYAATSYGCNGGGFGLLSAAHNRRQSRVMGRRANRMARRAAYGCAGY